MWRCSNAVGCLSEHGTSQLFWFLGFLLILGIRIMHSPHRWTDSDDRKIGQSIVITKRTGIDGKPVDECRRPGTHRRTDNSKT